jgi:hypothetical protein
VLGVSTTRPSAHAACMQISAQFRQLAAAQDGLITRRQALECGISIDAVRHAVGKGKRWQRVVTGVYATFTGPLQERHLVRAALLYAGPEAMVSGAVACRAYGLRYAPADGRLLLLVPGHVQRAPIPIAKIRRTLTLPRPWHVRFFPCAPPARAALDASRELHNVRSVRAVLCEVVQLGLALPDGLVTTLEQGHSADSALPRRALSDVLAGCRSTAECDLRDVLSVSTLLDQPVWNQPLPDAGGADLHPDACLARARLVVEVDSIEWHRLGDRVEATERRRARYAALGWTVLPVSPHRIREEPALVLAEIEAAFLAGLARAA